MGSSFYFGMAILLAWIIRATADGNLPNYVGLFTGGIAIPTSTNSAGSVPATGGSASSGIAGAFGALGGLGGTAAPSLAGAGTVGAGIVNSDLGSGAPNFDTMGAMTGLE